MCFNPTQAVGLKNNYMTTDSGQIDLDHFYKRHKIISLLKNKL